MSLALEAAIKVAPASRSYLQLAARGATRWARLILERISGPSAFHL
jgi:hypothetical protein